MIAESPESRILTCKVLVSHKFLLPFEPNMNYMLYSVQEIDYCCLVLFRTAKHQMISGPDCFC